MEKSIKIDIGVLTDGLKEQLNRQGYAISPRNLNKMEKIKNSIVILGFHEYIQENEKERMIQKFMDDLLNCVYAKGRK